jgi:hypothetical protein
VFLYEEVEMGRTTALVIVFVFAFAAGCGQAAPPPREPDAVAGATELAPREKAPAASEAAPSAPAAPHVCEAPITAPADVWPRFEAIRALSEEERAARCGLPFVLIASRWRSVPADILAPIVARAASDTAALDAWIGDTAAGAPRAAADVIAMDVAGRFSVGGDPKAGEERRAHWASSKVAGTPEIAAALEEAKKLPALEAEVNAVHELRCLLEVNALGFAVKCTPIHPPQTPISLSWSSTVRDGVLEKLELKSCGGAKSCPKLKKGAEKLMKRYAALVAEISKLESDVLQERLLALLVLPPFTSRSDTP